MKHIKLFETFDIYDEEDKEAIAKILAVSNEDWFLSGDDAPDDFRESLDEFETANEDIEEAVQVCTEGPGYTDVLMGYGDLISNAIEEGMIEDEDEAYEMNKEWFASERANILKKLPYIY